MKKILRSLLLLLFLSSTLSKVFSQDSLATKPDTISFTSGNLVLKGLLWKPEGRGPFPAVLFNHGSEANSMWYLPGVAKYFVGHGYAFFTPFRRGQTLSKGQGRYMGDILDSIRNNEGPNAAYPVIIRLHETEQFQDQLSGLQALKKQKGIDTSRIAVAGISFGGIQTMIMATKNTGIKAAVNFAGAAMMWDGSEDGREWMKKLAAQATVPVYFIQAENDFSIQPSIQEAAEMEKAGKTYKIKIYPPRGTQAKDGHMFVRDGDIWGPEVFAFLDKYLK
ncbi:hypothetical protein A3860_36945 [Niastella vici]|uniref:Dienelactone hydrolase domain-containing protein n=1 Tax=Niastella vici TaxID=1703345 RepID=A0A1V9FMS5_9BACT|nr:dienelactone hydrolase family protein [Niastella vici]OQP59581.1 hypothetical protein A3860_36945 [Niastella vici]